MSRRFEDIEVLVEGSFLLPHTVYVDHKTGRRTNVQSVFRMAAFKV